MTTLKTMILSIGAVALLGAGGLSAQTKAVADIPFAFTVQNTTLPAGQYTMSATSTSHDLMVIRNDETKQAILVIAPSSAVHPGSQTSGSIRPRCATRALPDSMPCA
jgi:hypothetical protein